MKTITAFFAIALLALWLADCSTANKPATTSVTSTTDPLAADRAKYLQKVRATIAGKENMRADSVFQKIERLKNVSAERMLGIMDRWGESLGVSCDHCHVNNEWASEVKHEKEITRQMMDLVLQINRDLGKMEALKGADPSISCYTCHHGKTHPDTKPK